MLDRGGAPAASPGATHRATSSSLPRQAAVKACRIDVLVSKTCGGGGGSTQSGGLRRFNDGMRPFYRPSFTLLSNEPRPAPLDPPKKEKSRGASASAIPPPDARRDLPGGQYHGVSHRPCQPRAGPAWPGRAGASSGRVSFGCGAKCGVRAVRVLPPGQPAGHAARTQPISDVPAPLLGPGRGGDRDAGRRSETPPLRKKATPSPLPIFYAPGNPRSTSRQSGRPSSAMAAALTGYSQGVSLDEGAMHARKPRVASDIG